MCCDRSLQGVSVDFVSEPGYGVLSELFSTARRATAYTVNPTLRGIIELLC